MVYVHLIVHRLDITLALPTLHACCVNVLKMVLPQMHATKKVIVIVRKVLQVISVTHVPMVTGDSLVMAVRVSEQYNHSS